MPPPRESGCNFSQWVENGSYYVSRHDKKGVFLATSPQDYSQALLRDVEFLVDMCFEQLREIYAPRPALYSPAWKIVTVYYYAFYAVQALSRIVGMPTTYLDDARVSAIKGLSSTPIQIGAGPFTITQSASLSATQSEYCFKKSNKRPHDAVWISVLQLLKSLCLKHKPAARSNDVAAAQEYQMFEVATSQRPASAFEGCDFGWPCEVRYEANYRVGNAYTMLRRPWQTLKVEDMKLWENLTTQSALDLLKKSLIMLNTENTSAGMNSRGVFLFNTANFIFALVRLLLVDLHGRRPTDWTWEDRRARFFKKNASILQNHEAWLFPNW